MENKKKKGLDLQWKILIGIVAGITLGIIFNKMVGPGSNPGLSLPSRYFLNTAEVSLSGY